MRYILAVLAITASPALAQQQPCAPSRADMAKILSDGKYHELPVVKGVAAEGRLRFELWANETTGTWTATLQQPNGMTCVVASGDSLAPWVAEIEGQGL